MPRRTSKKDSPAKLAGRMKRRWHVVLLRHEGEILGEVEAPDAASAKAAAAVRFDLDEVQRTRIIVQEFVFSTSRAIGFGWGPKHCAIGTMPAASKSEGVRCLD